ncbi:hypothetical protein F4821DRAFT_95303 [Hypoxylon rubiginosum]|uniref:Uncharacterized protein n=1 Tax=Hypoxylon rubiginosum TaxID=110542 RepID=A0ACC0D5V3_9PEZI|nr:hypothetical protein F4821DRAFT_95303 [Hypoxylon rubiginosum]
MDIWTCGLLCWAARTSCIHCAHPGPPLLCARSRPDSWPSNLFPPLTSLRLCVSASLPLSMPPDFALPSTRYPIVHSTLQETPSTPFVPVLLFFPSALPYPPTTHAQVYYTTSLTVDKSLQLLQTSASIAVHSLTS